MTPQQFITKWGPGGPAFDLNERQGGQPHFMDLCELLGVQTPGSEGDYLFEKNTVVLGEARGYADVFKRDHFAWENKAPGKNLDAALKQLLTCSLALSNPPLLVVCDRLTIRIHTQFNGHPSEIHTVLLHDLDLPDKIALLRRVWLDPESFRPKITSRDITNAAANSFATLAEGLRRRNAKPDDSAESQEVRANQVAHFLTQCLFCFFAEDVGLLPDLIFQKMINAKLDLPTRDGLLPSDKLARGLSTLFCAMRTGDLFGVYDIARFNGNLFKIIDVPVLSIMEVTELRNAANLNWAAIDVSIFGTLFERGLDPAKRSQLGAHYTDPATIMRIVQPVIERPLLQLWDQTRGEIASLLSGSKKKASAAIKLPGQRKRDASAGDKNYQAARIKFQTWLDSLAAYRILDPACGSGNFLFLGLKALKDIEHKSHLDAAALGLDREADLVTGPHNVFGIELNEYAAELARVTVWIGELQWRMAHGYELKTDPVLEPLDHIECRDALLTWPEPSSVRAEPVEAAWPKASVVIGNPPFLGGSKKRRELGDAYFQALDTVFTGRVPGGADLVCYWFEKARKAIETTGLGAAGLVATQSIRSGSNRVVLDAIGRQARIFNAWSDEPWVNEGAAVRVSLISFGWGECCFLNGSMVDQITAELGSAAETDMTAARPQRENLAVAFKGAEKNGAFDIPGKTARQWLRLPNPNGQGNATVVKPWKNGQDIANRPSDTWVVDFGVSMQEREAAMFEAPFSHVQSEVKTEREKNNREAYRKYWWRFGEARPGMRTALSELGRYIVTPRVAKHRYFVWLDAEVSPDSRLFVITRADDVTFGILNSRVHEVWSLANASMHGDGSDGGRPTYNAKSCFETFPFPHGLTPADTAHQQTETLPGGAVIPAGISEEKMAVAPVNSAQEASNTVAKSRPHAGHAQASTRTAAIQIAQAAKRLNDLREAWLNPPEWTRKVKEVTPLGMDHSPYPDRIEPQPGISEEDLKALQKCTLTNLYNQRPAWLAMAHAQLDAAVAAAYGWGDYTQAMTDEEILKRLLALNLARSATSSS